MKMPEMPSPPQPGAMPEHWSSQQVACYTPNELRAYAVAYGEAVREECARVCEAERVDQDETGAPEDRAYNWAIKHCAAAIRATSP